MIRVRHNQSTERRPGDCGLCARLAEGETHTKSGVEISPFCETCRRHHFAIVPCSTVGLPKATCPRCRLRKRALVDLPESARWERKVYGSFCEPCYLIEGYERVELESDALGRDSAPYEAVWYVKRTDKGLNDPNDISRRVARLFEGGYDHSGFGKPVRR